MSFILYLSKLIQPAHKLELKLDGALRQGKHHYLDDLLLRMLCSASDQHFVPCTLDTPISFKVEL